MKVTRLHHIRRSLVCWCLPRWHIFSIGPRGATLAVIHREEGEAERDI